MLFAQQVVDGFDGVEGGQGHFDKEGDPVGHGSVPEAGEFLRFEHGGSLAFLADESGGGVDVLAEVEVASFVVFGGADEVDGVEVCGAGKDGFLLGVAAVDLGGLHYLQAFDALCVACEEGAAAGFALVAHHAAYAYGAVEQVVEALGLLGSGEVGVAVGQLDVEVVLGKVFDGFELLGCGAFVEGAQVVEALLLEFEQQACKDFLVDDGGVFHPVGHYVVDVFDKDDVGALFVEVFDECAVAAGPEDELPVVVADGVVLFVDGYDVGVVLLFGEGDVEFYVEGVFVVAFHFGHFATEEGPVFGRDGEVEVDGVVAHAGVFGAFDDVFFEGCALQVAVAMEFEQAFGQVSVAQVLVVEQEVDDGGEVGAVHVVAEVGVVFGHACHEVVEEGEGAYFFEEFFDGGMFFLYLVFDAEVGGGEGVEVFEHAGGGSGGGDEFEDFLALRGLCVVGSVEVDVVVGEAEDASVVDGGCRDKIGFGESLTEVVNLMLHGGLGQAEGCDLLDVAVGELGCHRQWGDGGLDVLEVGAA